MPIGKPYATVDFVPVEYKTTFEGERRVSDVSDMMTMMDLEELFLRAEGKDCYICGKPMLPSQVLFVTHKSRVVVHDVCARRVEIAEGERRASRRDEDLTGPHKLPEAKETPPYRILDIKLA